jgi:hypothetical protein
LELLFYLGFCCSATKSKKFLYIPPGVFHLEVEGGCFCTEYETNLGKTLIGVGGLKNCGSFVQNTVYRSNRSPDLPKWGVGGSRNGWQKSVRGWGKGKSYR